jgi:heptosyltransferase-3
VESLLDRLPSGSRIAVIRLRSLGDCVLTTPALALLKNHRPDLKITVIVEPRFAAIFEGNSDVVEIRKDACAADLALNLHGGTQSMRMTLASRAKYRVGFGHHAWSVLYTHKIPRAQEILGEERVVHTAEHLASAMFWLGVPISEVPRAKLFAEPPPRWDPYAIVHPFAAVANRVWPPERFVEVIEGIRGLEPSVIAGPQDDVSPFKKYRLLHNQPLDHLKGIISGAAVLIGNNSGPAHIAAAFGVPAVVVFDPPSVASWSPWRAESQVLPGLDRVTPVDVLAALRLLMKEMHA